MIDSDLESEITMESQMKETDTESICTMVSGQAFSAYSFLDDDDELDRLSLSWSECVHSADRETEPEVKSFSQPAEPVQPLAHPENTLGCVVEDSTLRVTPSSFQGETTIASGKNNPSLEYEHSPSTPNFWAELWSRTIQSVPSHDDLQIMWQSVRPVATPFFASMLLAFATGFCYDQFVLAKSVEPSAEVISHPPSTSRAVD